ncbi:hypothetical protein HPB52_014628 [Rhipicephalus sanguineus]|uniref:Peptidase M13 C-terminal domain-containing protein n=1 Tax=Rhipicephalus sanguineus TaxID=34632 RepID=A0A9D4PD93_RHISA|nr:hypothetical protein HPB52_014628 [Rhipicephalus sanguineus]
MASPTPRDVLINRLVDRRPACASHNMYRSGDYDFIILLAFLAAVIVVFVLFFQYDFGQRLRQRVRTKRPAISITYRAGIASTSPSEHQAAQPGSLREVPALSEEPPAEVTTPEERAVSEQPITLARAEEALTMMAPVTIERTLGSCDGPGCREVADELRATLDDSASPCSDFYQHVCGKWVRNHTPELGEALVSERTLRRRRLESQLLVELRSGTDDGSLRWPLRLWRECSATTGEPQSHDVLRTIFAMHGLAGFPFGAADRHRDLSTTAAKVLSHSAIPALVGIEIVKMTADDVPTAGGHKPRKKKARKGSSSVVDERPSGRWVIRVGPPQPLFRDFVSMRDVQDEWFVAAVQSISGRRDMPELVEIEQALVDLAGERAGVDDYVPMPVARLQHSRLWNWTRFLRTALHGVTTIGSRTTVLIKGGSFQRRFKLIVDKYGSASLHNYLALRMYVRYSPFLDWKKYRALVDVATVRLPGWEDIDPPEHGVELRCLRFLYRLVAEPFAYIIWNANISRSLEHLESDLGALTNRVVDEALTFVGALNVTQQLTDRFRNVVSGLKHQLLVPAWMRKPSLRMKFSELVFSDAGTSPIVSWNGVLGATWRNAQRRLVDRGFETFWRGSALGDEPWLEEDEGYLAVAPGSVDKDLTGDAFYAHHLPRLGLDLARAMMGHFFRMASRLKRRYPAAHLRMELLADCLRRQFYGDKHASEVSAHHDAIDVLALPSVLHAFRRRFQSSGNGNLSMIGDTRSGSRPTDRLFFYEFARSRCEAYDDAYSHLRTYKGTRSPAPFFVNGPLRNTREFARAFRCPRGSGMRPKRICRL